jgi:hypothetical protein
MCACAHFVCLPPFLPANFNLSRQAEAKVFTIMCATQENPNFPLGRTRQTDVWHCSSPSALPRNCDAPFSTLPERLTSLTVRAHLPSSPIQGFFSLAKFRHFSTNNLISIWKVLFLNIKSTNFAILESNFAKFSRPKK